MLQEVGGLQLSEPRTWLMYQLFVYRAIRMVVGSLRPQMQHSAVLHAHNFSSFTPLLVAILKMLEVCLQFQYLLCIGQVGEAKQIQRRQDSPVKYWSCPA